MGASLGSFCECYIKLQLQEPCPKASEAILKKCDYGQMHRQTFTIIILDKGCVNIFVYLLFFVEEGRE